MRTFSGCFTLKQYPVDAFSSVKMNILPLCCLTLTVVLSSASANNSKDSISPNADKCCAETEADPWVKEGDETHGHISDEKQVEKRKWGDNSMRAWGKREGVEKRDWNRGSLRAWGKREGEEREVDKKTGWSKSRLGLWGKRDDDLEEEKRDQKESDDEKKRGWETSGPLRAWGKRLDRSSELEESPSKEKSKRDWNSRVRAWGKRDAEDDEGASNQTMAVERVKRAIEGSSRRRRRPKRSWSRSDAAAAEAFLDHINFYPPEGPKRSWRTNVIRVWGKRSRPTVE